MTKFNRRFNFRYFFHLTPRSAAGLFCRRRVWTASWIRRAEQGRTSHRESSGVCFSWRLERPASPGARRSAAPATPAPLRSSPTRPELPLQHGGKVNIRLYSYVDTRHRHEEALQNSGCRFRSQVMKKKLQKQLSNVSQTYCVPIDFISHE